MKKLITLIALGGWYAFVFAGDAQILNIDLPSKINKGNHWIEGDIKNNGSNAITSIIINCSYLNMATLYKIIGKIIMTKNI